MNNKDMPEKQFCTLCAQIESPGFYTGCLIKDGYGAAGLICKDGEIITESALAELERRG